MLMVQLHLKEVFINCTTDMNLHTGILVKSTQLLNDNMFADTVVLIVEYNSNGALGFVINKPFKRSLNELVEFNNSPCFPLYDGGPVDKEHLFFIHRRPDIIEGGDKVKEGIYYGGNFRQAVDGINSYVLMQDDIKIFVGYCGWDKGELEEEMEEGSWEIVNESIQFFK
jgi:putative transcriptional regulator